MPRNVTHCEVRSGDVRAREWAGRATSGRAEAAGARGAVEAPATAARPAARTVSVTARRVQFLIPSLRVPAIRSNRKREPNA